MKLISVILLLATFGFPTKEQPSYLIIKGKSINIYGNTTIGGIDCEYNLSERNDTLFINKLHKQPYSFSIPVKEISCGNFLLNRDLHATLRSGEYPKAEVQVLSLEEEKRGALSGNVKLTLVGKSRIYRNVNFVLTKVNKQLILNADFTILTSEYELKPVKKLGGMIKTEDAMRVQVALALEPTFEPWVSE